ncbi:hypothetical protein ONS95_012985 [Cadophora gregata]|uniref:uncharacterized protein n=1 Tax=Cadophora gregata TaxID=51156 RepID=UPI0026DC314C|nr:uncharacterized protein ONS95_012985 [Cadophora gregata]KAK0101028.1 hypothetical protein ONS96_006258 [Cadophora gregata f. sp. sojae]KAK0115943.1 hypothetical protein ONS95_012985 [Cadophora gregata]
MAILIPDQPGILDPLSAPSKPPPSSKPHEPPLSHSQRQPYLPSDCTICHSLFHTPRSDGTIETPSLIPCGHIFGSICINRWLESSEHKNCPNCRREMRYHGCGHSVIPKSLPKPFPRASEVEGDGDGHADVAMESDSDLRLRAVKAEDMPPLCLLCREGREMEEVVRRAERRLVAEERALEGLRVLPGLFGGLYKGSGSTSGPGNLGQRSEEARETWRRDMEVLREGLMKRMEGKEEW